MWTLAVQTCVAIQNLYIYAYVYIICDLCVVIHTHMGSVCVCVCIQREYQYFARKNIYFGTTKNDCHQLSQVPPAQRTKYCLQDQVSCGLAPTIVPSSSLTTPYPLVQPYTVTKYLFPLSQCLCNSSPGIYLMHRIQMCFFLQSVILLFPKTLHPKS